ncbi:uncharacterized protein G2W53_000513 [Senna tora]|uniref:DUF1677 family protein n=1 Tax=Senna tora TaxID=362788 RepID=A0A834XDT0_9FABA|nr:uncharacterized protein G2W53_000513 [Senna tora]
MSAAATMISDPNPMVITPNPETTQAVSSSSSSSSSTILVSAQNSDVEFAICECCGFTEECTPAYIERIRERYYGKWVCGLCAEAVKDEILRSERLIIISTEEAMAKHMSFLNKFKSSGPPINPTVHLISAMRQILRRSLDSPRRGGLRLGSTPSSPTSKIMADTQIHHPGLTRTFQSVVKNKLFAQKISTSLTLSDTTSFDSI